MMEQEVKPTAEIIKTVDLSRRPALCGATFKEHCQYPKCDCDSLDSLVDRDCAILDGHCDCERIQGVLNCKYNTF